MIYLIVSYSRPQLLKSVLESSLCVLGHCSRGMVDTQKSYNVSEALVECDGHDFVAVGNKLKEATFIADLFRILGHRSCVDSSGTTNLIRYYSNRKRTVDVCYYNGLYPIIDVSNLY